MIQFPFISRWHPVLALRYLPMIEVIKTYDDPVVVEVGSGGLGIGPYLKRPFVGVDVNFDQPQSKHLIPLMGSVHAIPLPSNYADIVVNSDMLEHIPVSQRQQAVNELFRIAKHCVIIGVPVGQKAAALDAELDTLYRKTHHQPHPFLAEHVTNGLPEMDNIKTYIDNAAKKSQRHYQLCIQPNQNLRLRRWLMKGWVSKNILVNIFFRKILLIAIPIMRHMNTSPVYRQLFIVRF